MRRPALAGLVAALVLAVAAAVVPPAAGPVAPFLAAFDVPRVAAADDLGVSTAARYVVVPEKGVIRVTVDVTTVNEKPNAVAGGVITRYFYDGVNLGVQPEATRFRATQDGVPVRVTADRKTGYRLVTVAFRSSLFYQQRAKVRLTYDLPAGSPRSSSDVRVGPAFASFLAWAFGDRGTVRIEVPKAFQVDTSGAALERSTTDAGVQVYRASTADTAGWYAWINASNRDGLTRQQVKLPGGDVIVVRGWPEDAKWRGRVRTLLAEAVPQLADRIGLPWPVDGPLSVFEVHTPLLEGYAGFYNRDAAEITISEALDDSTIVHEASHAWFNTTLFEERWITEGLAEEYAAQVIDALGGDAPRPKAVKRTAKAAFPLDAWPPPAPISDKTANAREQYGYDASYGVIHAIVKQAGEAGMRRVFAAASSGTTAYPGNGTPEKTTLASDWRRFLDLTEELGGATGVSDLIATWALPDGSDADLQARDAARAAYHQLVTAGDGWASPVVVRMALDGWAFDRARPAIETASAVLARRDAIDATAAGRGLVPPAGLEAAYEDAATTAQLDAAGQLADDTASSLTQVADAMTAASAPRDWLVQLGLTGKDPDGGLAAARAAWQAGDLATAKDTAMLVTGTLAVAADAGRGRVLVFGGSVGLVLVVLVIAVVWLRARSRRRSAERAAAVSVVAQAPSGGGSDAPLAGEALRAGDGPPPPGDAPPGD